MRAEPPHPRGREPLLFEQTDEGVVRYRFGGATIILHAGISLARAKMLPEIDRESG